MAAIPELTTEKPCGISHCLGRLLQAVHQVVLKKGQHFQRLALEERMKLRVKYCSTVNCDCVIQ
jgi:hypothetical protein